MKTTSSLIICLLIFLSSAGQVRALQNPRPIQGMTRVLQNQLDQQLKNSLGKDEYIRLKNTPLPAEQKNIPNKRQDYYLVPDCLCRLSTRVM